jgi:hypothetical protein
MRTIWAFLILCALEVFASMPGYARSQIQGDCSQGGVKVVTQGMSSTTKVQASYPGCTVTVYISGSSPAALASLYSDDAGTPLGNPFTSDSTGLWKFFAANGIYDVVLSGAGIPIPFTISNLGQPLAVDLASSANGNGDELVAYKASGSGAVARTVHDVLADMQVNVKDYGAKGDNSADDTVAIKKAITYAEASGNAIIYFPPGKYKITSTLVVTTGIKLLGSSPAFDESTPVSSLVFSGTGPAIELNNDPVKTKLWNPRIIDLHIVATGGAITDATAGGIKCIACDNGSFESLTIRDFKAGFGMWFTSHPDNGTNPVGAANRIVQPAIHQCKYGVIFDGVASGFGDFASKIIDGFIIGVPDPAHPTQGLSGNIGVWVKPYAAEVQIRGTDIETQEYGVYIEGDGVELYGTRTEFINYDAGASPADRAHVKILAGTTRTYLKGHRFIGPAPYLTSASTSVFREDTDSNVSIYDWGLNVNNNVSIFLQDSGGVGRTFVKMDTNDTMQLGDSNIPLWTLAPVYTALGLIVQPHALNNVPVCYQYVIPHTALIAASTTQDITLFTLPIHGKITGVSLKTDNEFTGVGISSITGSIGTSAAPTAYTSAFELITPTGDTVQQDTSLFKSATDASHNVIIRFTATGGNLGTGLITSLSSGWLKIRVCSIGSFFPQ